MPLFFKWSEASDDPILLEISGFCVKGERRRSLRPTRQFTFNDHTVITRLTVGSSISFIATGFYISEFNRQ